MCGTTIACKCSNLANKIPISHEFFFDNHLSIAEVKFDCLGYYLCKCSRINSIKKFPRTICVVYKTIASRPYLISAFHDLLNICCNRDAQYYIYSVIFSDFDFWYNIQRSTLYRVISQKWFGQKTFGLHYNIMYKRNNYRTRSHQWRRMYSQNISIELA